MLLRLPPAQAELDRRRTEALRRQVSGHADEIRDRCKTFRGFSKEAWPILEPIATLRWGWALDAITDHLQGVFDGHILRLRLNVPPGMMKSLLTTVCSQAYEWGPGGKPSLDYLTASWNKDYAVRDSRKTRDLVASAWYQELWGSTVQLKSTAEDEFSNEARGTRAAKPMLGLTSGRGDRLVIDDPHSTETAESDAQRKKTTRLFRESVTSRVNDPVRSPIIVVMQRLHAQDVSGVIEELGGYTSLVLPMEFERERRCHTVIGIKDGQRVEFTDPRKDEGELLFPERFPRDVVERDKKAMGAYAVAGQFQQRPSPREGGNFKRQWFPVVQAFPAGGRFVRAWDLASTEGGGDFTVGLLMCVVGRFYYIVDIVRFRGSPAQVDAAIKNTADQDAAAYGATNVRFRLPQDPGQAGKSQKSSHAALLAKYVFRILPVTGDKPTRARPLASQAEAGNVKMLEAPWNNTFLDEIGMFPNAGFDDQVDAAADAYNELVGTAGTGGVIAVPIVMTGSRPSPG